MHYAAQYGMVADVNEPFDLSPQDAAAILGCHEDTLKRWAAAGKVAAFRTPGGWWRFRRSDLAAFLVASSVAPADPTDAAS